CLGYQVVWQLLENSSTTVSRLAATGSNESRPCVHGPLSSRSQVKYLSEPAPPLDRDPHPVVPESPTIRAGVPLDLSPRRPRRWRWWRRSPRRRWTVTDRAAVVVVPVTAVVPVRVRAPALVPAVARAPVMVIHRCRRRCRLRGA